MSAEAKAKRTVGDAAFDGLVFYARIGIEPGDGDWPPKNVLSRRRDPQRKRLARSGRAGSAAERKRDVWSARRPLCPPGHPRRFRGRSGRTRSKAMRKARPRLISAEQTNGCGAPTPQPSPQRKISSASKAPSARTRRSGGSATLSGHGSPARSFGPGSRPAASRPRRRAGTSRNRPGDRLSPARGTQGRSLRSCRISLRLVPILIGRSQPAPGRKRRSPGFCRPPSI